MLVRVRRIIDEELTERQRQALDPAGRTGYAHGRRGAQTQDQSQCPLQILHDARLRLKRRLSMEDISPNEVLTLFEHK